MSAQPKPTPKAVGGNAPVETARAPSGLEASIFQNVRVQLKAKLGELTLSIEELLALKSGEVLTLDRMLSEPVDLFLNDCLVARGEIVAVEDNFGIRLIEIAAAA